MNRSHLKKVVRSVLLAALAIALFGPVVAAQSAKIEGVGARSLTVFYGELFGEKG